MENKKRGTGKSKKIVIGVATIVAVAAIAVPTALTLTGGNKDDAGANQGNKYNIVVSCGIDGVSDYSLSVSEGTKISELKSILKGVDGYRIEGIYKDDAMNHPYSDNETISASTKIYIKFVAVTYTVNIYAEDGITLLETQEVSHKDSLSLVAPTKAEDNFATYEFKGWYNERNELVNLNEITSDLNIHPEYRTIMKEYKIGYIGGEFKDSISVTIGGEVVDLSSTYHYGAKIVIRATQKVGRDITEFKVKVGNGETQDILTEAYRHEENGQVYYEYELDGNGDLSIIYSEAASEYSIGQIPTQVMVTRNGHTLSSNEAIYYGDQLTISYTESEGHHKETFAVNGAEYASGVWVVKGDLTIEYTESRNAYVLGTIPAGVTVTRDGETLNSDSVIYWGDVLSFTYTETSIRLTGNTKIENGFKWSEKSTTTNILKANGTSLGSGRTFTVNGDIALSLSSDTTTAWEKGEQITFANSSWSDINEVAQAGDAATVFSVGDEKDITLTDGEVLTVVILGFNHDNLTSGGKAKMSIGMKHLTATKAQMNTTNTNAGGWEASAMRTTLNDYYNKLPDDLKAVIKSVNKDASAGSQSSNITTSTDKLWLFSMAELCGQAAINSWTSNTTNQTVYKSEGSQYEYYRNLIGDSTYSDAGLVKKLSNGAGSANIWWLRSPYMYSTNHFLSVNSSGYSGSNNAYSSYGVCFGYCI